MNLGSPDLHSRMLRARCDAKSPTDNPGRAGHAHPRRGPARSRILKRKSGLPWRWGPPAAPAALSQPGPVGGLDRAGGRTAPGRPPCHNTYLACRRAGGRRARCRRRSAPTAAHGGRPLQGAVRWLSRPPGVRRSVRSRVSRTTGKTRPPNRPDRRTRPRRGGDRVLGVRAVPHGELASWRARSG